MAELPGQFWGGWVLVLTLASLGGLVWLVLSLYFDRNAKTEAAGPVWDGNLEKGEQPPPMWWFWLIFVSLVISVAYLMLYPGLGAFSGTLNWSQGGELQERIDRYSAEFGPLREPVAEADLSTLRADPRLMASAQGIYNRNCAACHGYDAQGQADLFPNLRDAEWQWGGDAEQIEQSIRDGRQAVMAGWLAVLGEERVDQLTDHVLAMGDGEATDHPVARTYAQFCSVCHAADGTGNPQFGAPSLIDDVTLYGNSPEAVRHSIAEGRNGIMPPFGTRLDDTQIRLLIAWLAPPEAADSP